MQRQHQSRSTVSAFTLIELLVVIAIIAILAAILFPVFAQAREKARAIACLSNTKQMGLAVIQYVQDYDETYPNGNYKYGAVGGWAGQIFPYTKSVAVYKCPDDFKVIQAADNPTSYGMNSNFAIQGNLSAGIPNIVYPISKLNSPSKTVLLFEVQGNTNIDVTKQYEGPYAPTNYNSSPFGNGKINGYSISGGGSISTCPPPTAQSTLKYATGYMGGRDPLSYGCEFTGPLGVHNGGANYLMADGHAKWFLGSVVSSGSNANTETSNETVAQFGNAAGTGGSINGVPAAATFSIQ